MTEKRGRVKKRRSETRAKPKQIQQLERILLVILCVMIVVTTIFAITKGIQAYKLTERNKEMQQEITQLKEQNAVLETESQNLKDPKYIEQVAREQLGLVKSGEVPYVH